MPTPTLGYDLSMCRWLLLSSVIVAAGCTKQNPAAKCSTGTCTDPAAPFCDVDGTIGGTPGMCLGVTCTPGSFAACRGDVALTCNQMGNNYDELQCSMGCTPEAMGCKLCQAGQTVCTNGEVQTCDMNGAVTSSQSCPLGCFQTEPRCRDIDPSNGLGVYADMVMAPPDVTLTAGAVFDLASGVVKDDMNTTPVDIPSFMVAAPTGGVAIRVYVVNSLQMQDGIVNGNGTAMAIVAKSNIMIEGTLTIYPGSGQYSDDTSCNGKNGTLTDRGNQLTVGGGGGGASATDGAHGGNVLASAGGSTLESGGAKGTASGTASLIPLRGGCPGAASQYSTGVSCDSYGSAGGGAIQLSSATSIEINGTIDVRGGPGEANDYQASSGTGVCVGGGGGGGGIIVEAPVVSLGASGQLLATGGDGGACSTIGCALGGRGATAGLAATQGADIPNPGAQVYAVNSGGGGGGLGRIRINTPDQTYTKSNTSVEDGVLSVGTLATR